MSGWRCSDQIRSCPNLIVSTRSSRRQYRHRGLGFISLGTLGEHRDANRTARTIGEVADATDHLIGVAGINTQFIAISMVSSNFAWRVPPSRASRIGERIKLGTIDTLTRLGDALGQLRNSLLTALFMDVTPRPAGPCTGRTTDLLDSRSIVSQFISTIFFSAISRNCASVTLPTKAPLPGSSNPRPASCRSSVGSLLEEIGHRRCFISKVKERSA